MTREVSNPHSSATRWYWGIHPLWWLRKLSVPHCAWLHSQLYSDFVVTVVRLRFHPSNYSCNSALYSRNPTCYKLSCHHSLQTPIDRHSKSLWQQQEQEREEQQQRQQQEQQQCSSSHAAAAAAEWRQQQHNNPPLKLDRRGGSHSDCLWQQRKHNHPGVKVEAVIRGQLEPFECLLVSRTAMLWL